MKIGIFLLSSLFSAGIVFAAERSTVPAALSCPVGTPSAASYTWNFKAEATSIFKEVASDAEVARNNADLIDSYERNPLISRELHAERLDDMKNAINDIEDKVCRLETIRRMLAPWQQRVVDQVAQTGRLMVDNAQDAIRLCKDHPSEIEFPVYWHYTRNLFTESTELGKSANDAVKFASVSQEYRSLGHELGVRSAS